MLMTSILKTHAQLWSSCFDLKVKFEILWEEKWNIFEKYLKELHLPAKQSIPWDLAMTATTMTIMMMMATMTMAITGPVPAAMKQKNKLTFCTVHSFKFTRILWPDSCPFTQKYFENIFHGKHCKSLIVIKVIFKDKNQI